jgi:hypothetical protein
VGSAGKTSRAISEIIQPTINLRIPRMTASTTASVRNCRTISDLRADGSCFRVGTYRDECPECRLSGQS